VIRTKLQVVVTANTHDEILRKVNKLISEYLEISMEYIHDHADIEIEVKDASESEEFHFTATAYIKIK
jgi:hypothetical protein